MIHEVRIPQLNVNDEVVLLVEWLAEDGKQVSEGESLCAIETSKVAAELEAEASGTLKHGAEAGTNVSVQSVIGWIADAPDELEAVGHKRDGS